MFPEEYPLILLDSKYDICMHFVKNGETCKMHKIGWCEGGLQLVDIDIKKFGGPDLSPRMKYIMLRLDN